ncbi:SH3 domain-containing protein [Sulfitobacter mediterraneus]|uniref:SH3 domain-containing protein n=1 Tax=Sulfitobacter mediterraneus TaxID=83219 RepID=UPI0019332D6C|nr:SH3 domain-containing protein [Sulfitobacter mediterraneus]MBM1309954.1 SH3 domain-containing protein [Sulfitobacter mediterraneus]MBM1313838.1 SH3 domain-containing protein [Sulfitobacter mediterraneus]MBM1322198.1 SH3 domain-containing protein [Sulfitobacter mediterraneus]MBM1326110.1 SH3 domain-containing protein [Sulfitobacter mediterraneus]MBM1397456.1 SH3 domain-containing protein [Sulfitobacter mediterraneus]
MFRFILVSFGFLGWSFYEMSGGADFDPINTRMARLEAVNPTPFDNPSSSDAQVILASAPAVATDTNPPLNEAVTRVSLNLTTLQEALDQSGSAATVAPAAAATVDPAAVPTNVAVTTASADTPAIIPSLIIQDDTTSPDVTPAALVSEVGLDIRTVSGNRVNVRGGPSTNFSVVSKLIRGDAVEILEDNGNGWVRMRSVLTGEEGWMADFLLSES